MTQLFYTVFNMSAGACLVIAVVLAARLLLQHGPRKYCYALWLVVLFRLLCPVSFESAVNVFSITKTPVRPLQGGFGTAPVAFGDMHTDIVNLPKAVIEPADNRLLFWEDRLAALWLVGILVLIGYNGVRGLALQRRLRTARLNHDLTDGLHGMLPAWLAHTSVWEASGLETAFAMGILRPRIYLPAGLDAQTQRYILAHECTHLHRGDPLWRLLGFVALCLHWFNPLVWAAWMISARDMEMSCDEAVVHKLGACIKKDYSTALLLLAGGEQQVPGKLPSFGGAQTKARIRNILKYKKPAFWLTAVTAVAMVCIGIFLAADPPDEAAASANSMYSSQKARPSGADQAEDTQSQEVQESNGIWYADLTHDGSKETIRFDLQALQQTGLAKLTVESLTGKALYEKELSTSHVGWGTVALYEDSSGQYLFEYNPNFGQGAGSYSYKLFCLDHDGKVLIKDSGAVDFSAGMPYGAPKNDVRALIRFTNAVNTYWEKSALLVTTDKDSVLQNLYDTKDNAISVQETENYYIGQNILDQPLHYIEQMSWTNIILNGKKPVSSYSLRTRLVAVNRILARQRKMVRSMESGQE